MNNQSKELIDKWAENRRNLPLKDFVLTFSLINGDVIKVKAKGKDVFDIRRSLERGRLDFDRTDINNTTSIYKEHVVWFGIDEN
ncbi:hypothetical protein [Paenibacillus odorifer]|uniref:hypothetical protein n=1 Tax=Paenibacillus odorifer TaxID=189426 RepID=UPI00117ED0DB|nr:hypothetical protein [Paenibacillus odorifer]